MIIGHKDFLDMGIVKEYYSLMNTEDAEKWVQEDIIDHYGLDYRVHIVRVTTKLIMILLDLTLTKL